MADFIIGGQINIDGGNAEKSVGSIKQQLRDAQKELVAMSDKFGATSAEAVKAAKKVGEFKDKIGDAKTLSDAFNPDAKFKGLSNALQGVVGGFAALQGAQALFGSQSEDLQKVLVKVQGAMALSQGINSILESKDAFKALGAQVMQFGIVQKVVTAGQWLWNAAMAANPIGAVVAVVAALIAGIVALTSWLISNANAAKAQEAAVKSQTKAIESQNKTLERNNTLFEKSQSQQLALAKAQGQSAQAIRALEIKLADEKIAYEKSSAAIAKNTMDKQRNLYETLKSSGASDEVVKKQLDNLNKSVEGYNNQNKNIEKALQDKKEIENKHIVEIAQAKTDATNKEAQATKEANEKAKAKQDEIDKQKVENAKAAAELLKNIKINLLNDEQKDIANLDKKYEEDKLALKKGGITDFTELDALYKKDKSAIDKKYRNDEKKAEADYQKQLNDIILATRLAGIKDENKKERESIIADYKSKMDDIDANENLSSQKKTKLKLALQKQEQQALDKLTEEQSLKAFNKKETEIQNLYNDSKKSFAIREQAIKDEHALLEEGLKNNTISQQEYNDRIAKLAKSEVDIALEKLAAKQAIEQQYFQTISAGVDFYKSILDAQSQSIQQKQEQDTNAQKAQLDSQQITKEQYEANIAKINEEAEKKKRKIQRQSIIAEKAIAISGIILNTLQANAKALLMFPPTGQPFITFNTIQGALAVATTIAQASKALAALGGGGGGGTGGGGGLPSSSGGGGTQAPIQAQLQTTTLNQSQIQQMGNAAVRSFVVESDVSGNQERIRRLNRAARIN
jgi:hypothetical protein